MLPALPSFSRCSTSALELRLLRSIGVALVVFAVLLGGPRVQSAEPAQEWQTIKKHTFSFSVPKHFKRVDAQGFEGMIEQYVGDGVKLWFDDTGHADNLENWPKGTEYEQVKVGNDAARIATQNRTSATVNGTSSTAIYVQQGALGMYAWCQTEKDIALAKRIFLTIRLAPPAAPDGR
jgi:hypothetical protein